MSPRSAIYMSCSYFCVTKTYIINGSTFRSELIGYFDIKTQIWRWFKCDLCTHTARGIIPIKIDLFNSSVIRVGLYMHLVFSSFVL